MGIGGILKGIGKAAIGAAVPLAHGDAKGAIGGAIGGALGNMGGGMKSKGGSEAPIFSKPPMGNDLPEQGGITGTMTRVGRRKFSKGRPISRALGGR